MLNYQNIMKVLKTKWVGYFLFLPTILLVGTVVGEIVGWTPESMTFLARITLIEVCVLGVLILHKTLHIDISGRLDSLLVEKAQIIFSQSRKIIALEKELADYKNDTGKVANA